MNHWQQLFMEFEDKELYSVGSRLSEIMLSKDMTRLASDCGCDVVSDYMGYLDLKRRMGKVISEYIHRSFEVWEDSYSEEEQIEDLNEFFSLY